MSASGTEGVPRLVSGREIGQLLEAERKMFDEAIRAMKSQGHDIKSMYQENEPNGIRFLCIQGIGRVFSTRIEFTHELDPAAQMVAHDAEEEGRHEEARLLKMQALHLATVHGTWVKAPPK